jgi:hypothetical protein
MTEALQTEKRQSIKEAIRIVDAPTTPYTTMVRKGERPKKMVHDWQMKKYKVVGHSGVMDNQDAANFSSNPRATCHGVAQKTWDKPAVSDFAEETEVAGLSRGEMAEQVADAIIAVKHAIERRCLSAEELSVDDGVVTPNATRGAFVYILDTAQSTYPVPAGYRPASGQFYASTIAALTETTVIDQFAESYISRKGPRPMDAFVGIKLKRKIADFTKYNDDSVTTKVGKLRTNRDQDDADLVHVVDRLVLDTGTVDLHLSSMLYTTAGDGSDNAQTHRSGIAVDMETCSIDYIREPRVVKLPYLGGGQKAIVDTIFIHVMENVLGAVKWTISE